MRLISARTFVAFLMFLTVVIVPSIKAGAQGETAPGRDVTVRVGTYNIHAGIGSDGIFNLDRTANTIRESGAAIIGLQEVDVHWGWRSQFNNEIKRLAEKLDMNYFFAPIYNLEPSRAGDPRRRYGVAVLSEFPIIVAENHEITRLSTQDDNPYPNPSPGFLEAKINVNGAIVSFYVTHLDYRADPTVREMQVADMLRIMSAEENNILVGDMNATPESPELKPLFSRFTDSWAADHGVEDEGYTYSAASPVKRIDYVLTSPDMEVESARVHRSLASDHLPVTADVTLTRGQ